MQGNDEQRNAASEQRGNTEPAREAQDVLGAGESHKEVAGTQDPGDPAVASLEDKGEDGGPFLCFSKHTGYGGYGNWNRGARVVRLEFDDLVGERSELSVQTWVRMENGGVVTKVTLNDTYGIDRYPTATGD